MSDKPQTLADAIGVCLALGQRCLAEVRALARVPGPQGPPGPPGPPGRNAADVDLFKDYIDQCFEAKFGTASVTSPDGGRTQRWLIGGKTLDLKTATVLDAGVWKEGVYQRGDAVTHGGSLWIAQQDTSTKPDTPQCDWRLAVKRGRDGKDGKPGERGAAGPRGEQGQRGFPV
jgi:integrin beta 3